MLRSRVITANVFERVVGELNWLDRADRISADVKGHPHLASLALEQNRVAFALADFSSAKKALGAGFRINCVNSIAEYEVWSLVAQFDQLYQGISGKAQHSLLRRMQSAFNNPDDMRALQFEWMIAVHMAKRGFVIRPSPEISKVAWSYVSSFRPNYLLVRRIGMR